MKAKKTRQRPPQRGSSTRPLLAADKLFETVVETLSNDTRISTSKMFGSPGLKIGGKVFAMLVKGKLVVKLPKDRVEVLVTSGEGEYFDPGHGRLMKEWVTIEPASGSKWFSLAGEAKDFVASGL